MNLVHCDLKPENIMIVKQHKSVENLSTKIIDFGTVCFNKEPKYMYIQSRFYRAPEVVLELLYGNEIDLWSFGCILYEIFEGKPLFPCSSEFQLMKMICEAIG